MRVRCTARPTTIGITNCLFHEASILTQLGEYGDSLTAAARIKAADFAALPRERRTHHLLDTALAQCRAGQLEDALDTLLDSERFGPQEIHCRLAARTVIAELLSAETTPPWRLRALGERSGVANS